jgi:hypothetical protein
MVTINISMVTLRRMMILVLRVLVDHYGGRVNRNVPATRA